jgi:hypothetical protein
MFQRVYNMLEFETEELSLQLVASSETHKYRTYWIDEAGAWTYLQIVTGTPSGPVCKKPMPFLCVEDAIEYANDQE